MSNDDSRVSDFPFVDEYEARKGGYSVEEMAKRVDVLKSSAPDWFRFEAGFRFFWDNGPAVLLGPGSFRTFNYNADHNFYMPEIGSPDNTGILITFFYKGEWHFKTLGSHDFLSICCWDEGIANLPVEEQSE